MGKCRDKSPFDGRHSFQQGRIAIKFEEIGSGGHGLVAYPVRTDEGVKVMDAAWMSKDRAASLREEGVHEVAPEICVEVRSPGNSFHEIQEKLRLYFAKGAVECWVCDRNGLMTFFNADGPIRRSELCPEFPEQVS